MAKWGLHERTTEEQARENRRTSMFKMEEDVNHPWEDDDARINNGENTEVEAPSATDDVLSNGDDLSNDNLDDELA